MNISAVAPPLVDFISTSKYGTTRAALRSVTSQAAACGAREIPLDKEINSHEFSATNGINRITSKFFHTEKTRGVYETLMAQLDKAINLQQSDHIADARKKLQGIFETVRNLRPRFFGNPTKDGWRVLRRGKKLFLEDGVCCSVKYGTLLLDSSDSGTQFYSSLLNVIGAFAEGISEFKLAKETFSLLIDFHQHSDFTSRKHDLGAAHNNTGCIFLMLGDLEQAEYNFRKSLYYLESAEQRHQLHFLTLETMSIAVHSNIGRLHQLSRNYCKALEKQEQLVESCKTKEVKMLPLQVVFTLLNNLAVLYTTLGKFSKAEQELKWMVSYCYQMNREDCDFLLNFVALHLSEVFLFRGKPKEAEKTLRLDDDIDFAEMFGGLHINVRIETVEKLVDVMVLKGKIRHAREVLDRGVNSLKHIFGSDHLNVASLLYKQGKILTLAGEVSNAAEKFKCSIAILEEMFGIKHPLLLKCYMSVGELALRSKQEDESYFYFQRAMENIEAIYQVSFVNQLSRTYLEMTSSNNFHQSKMLEDTWKIEGLVAEHGVVLAVLLSRPVVLENIPPFRRSKTKLKQPLSTNNRDVHCAKEIVSFKYTRDFLQTAQTFLGQGMKKEAAAFFQLARKYSMALDATRGPVYTCIARLYDVLTEKRLGNGETLKNKRKVLHCLKELKELCAKISNESSSKRSTEATATATFDDQLNIQLVLIFLILLSIEMKMIDTTFAAYDLYSRISHSQNEDGFLHVQNGEVQVYASKVSITCNGKTALQDFFVSSTVGLNKTDSQRPLHDDELYRSLAFKKNAHTDSFLVAYNSSVFLDIEELRKLDSKVSLSVQECFQQKCFETGVGDSGTQVVVDLTKTASSCDHHSVLLTGSRVELLSLCLLQGAISEIPQGGNISEFSTAMCQKTVHLTFEDEQTSYFMFSKNALYLLQQCSSGKISTLSVQHQCLSLTITHPVKARVTLWRNDRSISQKIQFVQTTTRKYMADWRAPRQECSAQLEGDFAVAERLFLPGINHLANAYRVPCKTAEYSDKPPDVSDVHCEQSGFLLDGLQPKERKVVSLRMEKSETLRNNLNAYILENLTIVSELSSQLCEETIQEGDNDFATEAHRVNISSLPISSQSQFEQEVTSGECNLQPSTLTPEANIQSRHSSFEAPNLAGEEETPETRETYPTLREEADDNLLGKRLFEKDRDSRHSLITELYHEMTRKSNLINQEDGPSDEVTQQVGSRVIDPQNAATCHTGTSHNQLTSTDITNSSFENWTLNPTAELRDPNLMEEQSKPDPKDDEDALERHLLEKGTQSTGSSIVESKRAKKDEVLPTGNNKIRGLYENQQLESSPVPGQSARIAKDEAKKSITGTAMHDSKTQVRTENVSFDNRYRSKYLSSTYGQTQHLQDVSERQTKHAIVQGEKHETISPMQRSDERESHDGQNEPLVNKDFAQAYTTNAKMAKREKSRSSFNVYDDTVPEEPIRTSNGIHNSSIDLMASRYTDVADGPLKTVGNNLQIQSGFQSENGNGLSTSQRQIVDEKHCEELHPGTQRNDKLRTSQQSRKDASFWNSQLAFLGGDVLVDGAAKDSLRKEDKMVNGPALTDEAFTAFQDGTEGICVNEIKPFPSDAARDAVDGPVYSRKSEDRGYRSVKEEVLPTWNEKIHATEDSVEDQGLYENQQVESAPVPGQRARIAKDEVNQSLIDTAMRDSKIQIRAENVTLDNQYRSNYLSSTFGQTQHLQDVIESQTKHTILEGENNETSSPMEIEEEYIFQRRDERESRNGQNEPLVKKDFPRAFTIANRTKREKSRSSFSVYDDTVPDGPIRTSNGIHDSSTDLMASRYTDVVDGPLKTTGNILQIQSGFLWENANGMLTSRRQIVDEKHCEELHPGTRRNDKSRASQQSRKDTSFWNPQLAFLGGDVLVDGAATDSLRKEDKVVNGSALTNEAFTRAVDGPVHSLKGEDPRGFGGARPKQISPNSIRRNSYNETGEIGLKSGFLARHTVNINGAVLDLPRNEPYFSAQSCKNITFGDELQLPGERINPPGYRSISSSQGLHAQGAFAARTSTQGTAQAPAIHQEPWHFPPPENPNGDQGVCVSQQNASQSENFVKALFSSHGSRSAYDEMDSMSDEYQNSMRKVDNGMVKSPAASYGHYSSTKDSISSLLGSLQQIMSKTVNLVASSNTVAMQPQKKSKEAVKLSIQEEARGSREQEQAVRTGVEDSRNQEESTQDNGEPETQPILTPVQETPRPVCSHYQRRCLVRFPCCEKFYPCHRCHNESKDCSEDQARATNATHIRCSICYHEQVIDEQSQTCGGCKSKMSEYFCSTCKHFTSVDKNPFHCDKCGICRIHRDRSFHCDVCNVCLDKRLQGKHKCRPDSGHDECCICLEDAFSGCQILPCSHKVHKDCAIAMIQNGVRSCPICRHPLFSQPQNSPQ